MIEMDFLAWRPPQEEFVVVQGQSLPPDSIRSCELAVECWHLRKTIIELEKSNKELRSEMKIQKHVVRRMQEGMHALQSEYAAKDKEMAAMTAQFKLLEKKAYDAQQTRNCMVSTYSKAEQQVREMRRNYSRLEIEIATVKSQLAQQEQMWSERYSTMEGALGLDIAEAEDESRRLRDELASTLKSLEASQRLASDLQQQLDQLQVEHSLLQRANLNLQDRCAWGAELEHAYESLHQKLEIALADRSTALNRVQVLKQEKKQIYSFALSEGIQLPTFSASTASSEEGGDENDRDDGEQDEGKEFEEL